MAQIDLRHASIILKDGAANSITVKIGEGSLDYTEKRNLDPILNRGTIDTVRQGDDEPTEVSFSFVWEYITAPSGQAATVEDALKKTGPAASWISTSSDTEAPYCVDVEIIYTPPCTGGTQETILLAKFNYTELAHSLKDGTVSVKGFALVTETTTSHSII